MTYTSAQRSAIQQFVAFTQCPEKTAAKYLKNCAWNLDVAVDRFFHSSHAAPPVSSASTSALNKIFDEYRSIGKTLGDNSEPDIIAVNGAMRYLEAIGVSVEDHTFLIIAELLKAPTIGQFERRGFVDGWKSQDCSTIAQMKSRVPSLRTAFETDEATFKRVYLYTYTYARTANQKSLPLDEACVYWRTLLGNNNNSNSSSNNSNNNSNSNNHRFTAHLPVWIEFLETEYKKSIAKDTWNCMYDFVLLAQRDPGLETYDVDGAWPSILDEFVGFWRRKHGHAQAPKEEMETS